MRSILAAFAALAALAGPAAAQSYPSRPITVVVPFPAGGPSDVVARIVTEQMGKLLGQTMVIENVGGAGGTIGSARVASAASDGYTLLAGSMGSHVSAPVLTPNVKYDSARDFEPIGFTAHAPAVIVARKDFPANDLRDFVAYLKQNGEAVKQAHGGIGASSHMACVMFSAGTGVKPTAGRLSRHRARDERSDRRPCRFLLRAGGERHEPDRLGCDQGLRGLLAAAARDVARRADREGGRHRLCDGYLGRHLRPEGDAEGNRRQACRRARQVARRPRPCRSASPISAVPSPQRASAARRSSTRS